MAVLQFVIIGIHPDSPVLHSGPGRSLFPAIKASNILGLECILFHIRVASNTLVS